jgi:peptidoglycan/xylan/chitin deacetylase (PgdA/CDA1 family)
MDLNFIKKLLMKHNSQLSDNTSKFNSLKRNAMFNFDARKPLVTFIDDDGNKAVYTRLYPLFQTKSIKGSSAIITSWIDGVGMTTAQLQEMYAYGWEYLGHGYNYINNLSEFPVDADLDYQLGSGCKGIIENKGFIINGFVYPQGYSDLRIRRFTQRYYDFAFADTQINTGELINSMKIKRIALGYGTGSNPTINSNSEKNTLAYYKACVDYAVSNTGWLVFMIHCGTAEMTEEQWTILRDLIDYIKTTSATVVTPTEGNKIFGNQIYIGDYDDKYVIVNKNGLYIQNDPRVKTTPIASTEPITSYTSNTITSFVVYGASATGYPGSGIVTTYRIGGNGYDRQEFRKYLTNELWSRYVDGTGAWTAWVKISTV